MTVDELAAALREAGYSEIDVYAKGSGWFLDADNGERTNTPGYECVMAYAPTVLEVFTQALADALSHASHNT